MQRRTFLGWIGAGTALASFGLPAATAGTSATHTTPATAPSTCGTELEALFRPILGRSLGDGYRVTSVSSSERGAVTIEIARGPELATVRVFRRACASSGLATTRLLDLRLMNGADGVEGTHEGVGVAVMTLAARIARLEEADAPTNARAVASALVTHDAYLARHGGFLPRANA